MPFQGNPNAGAPDPALINMLFQQKQRREEMQWEREKFQIEAQRQAQLDAAEEARKERAAKLEELTKRAKLVMDMEGFGKPIDSARRNAEQVTSKNFTEEDLLGGGGGEDFASIVAQNDPSAGGQLQESNAAQSYLAAQLAGAAPIVQELNPGVDPISSLFGAGQAVETQRGREASLAEGVKVADAARANAESDRKAFRDQRISQQNTRFADDIRDINVQSDVVGKEIGSIAALEALQGDRKAATKMLNRRKAAGLDTSELEERLRFVDSRISNLKNPRTTISKQALPASERVKLAQQFSGASFSLNRIEHLADAFESGELVSGLSGLLLNMRARGAGAFKEIIAQDPEVLTTDLGQLAQQALSNGETTVVLSDQLTLGLDQLSLAYDFARMGRGNARFTIKEMATILDELGFTGVFTTRESVRGSLRKVAMAASQEKAISYELLSDDEEFRERIRGMQNLPEDEAILQKLKGDRPQRSVLEGPPTIPGKKKKPADWKAATPEELLMEFGR